MITWSSAMPACSRTTGDCMMPRLLITQPKLRDPAALTSAVATAAAERAAAPADHEGPDIELLVVDPLAQASDHVSDLPAHGVVKRVRGLGPVQVKERDTVFDVELNRFISHPLTPEMLLTTARRGASMAKDGGASPARQVWVN
jgi:hypothetical protein